MGKKSPALEVLGSPDSPGGALIITRGLEGIAQRNASLARFKMMKHGIQITPAIEAALQRRQYEDLQRLRAETRARGVPDKLTRLMAAKSKNEAERLAGAMTVTLGELANLNWNYNQIGFTHREKHPESAPKHVVPSEQEIHALLNTGVGNTVSPEGKKALRKIDSLQKERRCVSAHMFENIDGWHLFYCSYEDGFHLPWKPNHWEHGGTCQQF